MVTDKRGGFSKSESTTETVIPILEAHLIQLAHRRNYQLRNIKGTNFWREAIVPGIVNNKTRNFDNATNSLRGTLGID